MSAPDGLLVALAWTLVHSLWQLALLGAGCALVLAALEGARPEARERVCLAALALSLLVPAVTFVGLLSSPVAEMPSATVPAADRAGFVALALPWLAVAWLAGVAFLLLRHAVGLVRLGRLVRSARVDDTLDALVRRIAARLGLRRAVRVLVTARVDVPATVGWLRPVLLLPVGLANALSPREVEAVLAHELAHVRRRDFLVNLLVTLVETLLFHHPAVRWVARRLRAEREYCCDDRAALATGRPRDVASALAALEAHRQGAGAFPMSANGGSLMVRIRRLVDPRGDAPARRSSALAAASGALLVAAALAAPSVACDEKKKVRVEVSSLPATIEIEVVPAAAARPDGAAAAPRMRSRRAALPDRERVVGRFRIDAFGRPIAPVEAPEAPEPPEPPEAPEPPELAEPMEPGEAPEPPEPPEPPAWFETFERAPEPPPAPRPDVPGTTRHAPSGGGVILGRVVDADGRPLAGVHVLPAAPGADGAVRGVRTDAEGRFAFPAPGRVVAPAPDRAPARAIPPGVRRMELSPALVAPADGRRAPRVERVPAPPALVAPPELLRRERATVLRVGPELLTAPRARRLHGDR